MGFSNKYLLNFTTYLLKNYIDLLIIENVTFSCRMCINSFSSPEVLAKH